MVIVRRVTRKYPDLQPFGTAYQTTIALRFAELAEREQALVAAADAADAARLKAEEEANELRAHIKDLESDNEILCNRLKIDEQDRRDAEATRDEYRKMARSQL